jgi:hypothetical protein
MNDQMKRLQAPFPLESVSFKPQVTKNDKAMVTTYIDARAVVQRLDEVFPFAWGDDYTVKADDTKKLVLECALTLTAGDKVFTRRDVGESGNSDREASRWKSAYSDAFKRAAVKFGIGAYLYNLPKLWVEYDSQSKRITPAGIKKAENAYLQAVKHLGLEKPGERSQGQLEEDDEAPEKPVKSPSKEAAEGETPRTPPQQPTGEPTSRSTPSGGLSEIRANVMHRELEKLGMARPQHLQLATITVNRKVGALTELTESEATAVWNAARRAVNKDVPPFEPNKHPQSKAVWETWRNDGEAQAYGSKSGAFNAGHHMMNAWERAKREVADWEGDQAALYKHWYEEVSFRLEVKKRERREAESKPNRIGEPIGENEALAAPPS